MMMWLVKDGDCFDCRKIAEKEHEEQFIATHSEMFERHHSKYMGREYSYMVVKESCREQAQGLGYYNIPYIKQNVIHIEADCHGDAMTLCEGHFKEWVEEVCHGFKIEEYNGERW